MCQFNNIILSGRAKIDQVKDTFRQFGFNLTEVKNESLKGELTNKVFFISPKDHCDCGSVISIGSLPESTREISDKELDKLRYKGWSETKIKNYITSKRKGQAKMTMELDSERKKWNELIKSIFTDTDLEGLGILTHNYEGDLSSEVIKVKARHKLMFSNFQADMLDKMCFDEYYEIIRG